tara:strand:+ start:680 stop:940 length:261 start_codon:yes stop_codon:yes gene_type:complete
MSGADFATGKIAREEKFVSLIITSMIVSQTEKLLQIGRNVLAVEVTTMTTTMMKIVQVMIELAIIARTNASVRINQLNMLLTNAKT